MKKELLENNLIMKKTFEFSLKIIEFSEALESKRKFNMANQIFRSGTSIGANVWEAQNAESKADFIHKFKIAGKEMDETSYWLLLSLYSASYPDTKNLIKDLEEISKIITKIISTSKSK